MHCSQVLAGLAAPPGTGLGTSELAHARDREGELFVVRIKIMVYLSWDVECFSFRLPR